MKGVSRNSRRDAVRGFFVQPLEGALDRSDWCSLCNQLAARVPVLQQTVSLNSFAVGIIMEKNFEVRKLKATIWDLKRKTKKKKWRAIAL